MTRYGSVRMVILASAVLCLLTGITAVMTSNGSDLHMSSDISVEQQPAGVSASPAAVNNASPTAGRSALLLRCVHYSGKDFWNSVTAAANKETALSDNSGKAAETAGPDAAIAGGILPHHLLAGNMIAEFFETLSENPPETLVVIGPNHKRTGIGGLHTSTLDWGTSFGVVETDQDLTQRLVTEYNALQNDSLMENEHSVSSLVPYVSYYLPGTKLAPILLHGNYPAEDSLKLGSFLAQTVKSDPGIAVIASIDFSHYLDTDSAGKMDEITLEAIRSRDLNSISRMGNDNLDSPASLITFLGAMDQIGAAGPEVTAHDNSYGITGGGADYTTSYFTMFFRKPDRD